MNEAKLKLGEDEVVLRLTNRARFRIGDLKEQPRLDVPHKAYHGICSWVWAMLPREMESAYPSPEDVADKIDMDNIGEATDAVLAALSDEAPAKGSAKKKQPKKRRSSGSKRG